jgi:hypothetical protein
MENEINSLVQTKQELLKSRIIDQNLNKDLFLEFCIEKKQNGDDLDNWTVEELESTIKDFSYNYESLKQSKSKQSAEKEDEEIMFKKSSEEIKPEQVEAEIEKINICGTTNITDNESEKFLEKEISCRIIEKSKINDKRITITIRE